MKSAFVLIVVLMGCGGDDGGAGTDAGSGSDAQPAFDSCTGDCAVTTLRATFGANTRDFEQAYFGVSANEQLYVEAYVGGQAGCPEENSPAPDATLIVPDLDRPLGPGAAADFGVTLFDFEGALLPLTPTSQTTGTSLRWTAADGDLFVAFDFTATFDDGTIEGHAHATHCDSLDEN